MALEMLQVADAVAREKSIDKELVLEAMEQAIQMGARRKYGMGLNINAHIDRVDGGITIKQLWEVVDRVMEPISEEEVRLAHREGREPAMRPAFDGKGNALKRNDTQILLAEAKKINPELELGEFITEDVPPFDFGRIAAQAAKQVIFQKVRDAERVKEFEEYKNRKGELISGIVKRVDHNGVLVDLGRAEATLPRNEIIPRETYRQGDRVRAYIFDVRREVRGPQIFLSRTHPQFMVRLFEQEVPEIASGMIEVMGAARDPGFRAKIAVKSADRNVDPVGACVGIRGVRVQAVVTELQGERIDIVQWDADPARYLISALAPAEVTKVILDETENRMEVVVPEDKLSLAIGRRGQNVRLASILTGWDIDVMTEEEESERRKGEFNTMSQTFMAALDVDDTLARLLIVEGFNSPEDLLRVGTGELGSIEGLDEAIGAELQRRAQVYVDSLSKEVENLGVEEELRNLDGMRTDLLLILAKNDIKSRDDLGELATDELQDMLPKGTLTKAQAEKLIMAARQHWFADEDEVANAHPKPDLVAGTMHA
ncbi:MAG: transcription termination/antitermination protein NusA [Proteobacteria bacterium]|nr:transcription termination/antitermination protein NusA [Pseudomonadota bacterium]